MMTRHDYLSYILLVALLLLVPSTVLADHLDPSGSVPGEAANWTYMIDNFGMTEDDYFTVAIRDSGNVNIADGFDGDDCIGYTDRNPDFKLEIAGLFDEQVVLERLRFFFVDSVDTTLVVHTPDNKWYCNDDFNNNTRNPLIEVRDLEFGEYAIWVGTYERGEHTNGQLYITRDRSLTPMNYPLQLRPYDEQIFGGRGGGPDGSDISPQGSGEISNIRYSIEDDGLYLWAGVQINGYRNQEAWLVAWPFYTSNSNYMPNNGDPDYIDGNGLLWTWTYLTPGYDNTSYSDLRLFIPWNQFPQGDYTLGIYFELQDPNGSMLYWFRTVPIVDHH